MKQKSFKAGIRQRYSGRGNGWVKIPNESIAYQQVIDNLKDKEARDYLNDIEREGYAWVRFISPSGTKEEPTVTFEIRYNGSKFEQQDARIEVLESIAKNLPFLGNTPFKLELESKHIKKKKESVQKPKKERKEKKQTFISETQQLQDDFEEMIQKEILNAKEAKLSLPSLTDIEQWKTFLKEEGLLKDEI